MSSTNDVSRRQFISTVASTAALSYIRPARTVFWGVSEALTRLATFRGKTRAF